MKKLLVLALLPLLATPSSCAASPTFGDDSTGDTGTTDDGTTGDGGGDETTPPPSGALASGITVSGVTVLQAVEVTVMKNGAMATKNAPIVAGRKGLLRAFVTPGSGWTPKPLTALLTLHTAGQAHLFTSKLSPTTASTDASFTSTFNFNVDAASFGADTTFLVQLFDSAATGTGDSSAQFPTTGTPASMGVQTSGTVKIYVFPINFTSYSAGTAATGGIDINAYQSVVMGLYPATNVVLTVQPVLNYSGPVPDASGNYWSQLLNTMIQKRASEPAADVYYYGAFAPTSSFSTFCGGGCMAGLSSIPSSPSNTSQKAGIGLVYGGNSISQLETGQTMAHEVGHGHGRVHSPTSYNVQGCSQPSGIDPGYPYADGAIGVWGWDINASKSIDPSQNYDVMGYCAYDWISDYTYSALFQWVATDNGADMMLPSTPTTYRQIIDNGNGTFTLGEAFPVYGVVSGTPRTVTYESGGTSHTVTGYYAPYDHVPGGYILAPEPAQFTSVQVSGFPKVVMH